MDFFFNKLTKQNKTLISSLSLIQLRGRPELRVIDQSTPIFP